MVAVYQEGASLSVRRGRAQTAHLCCAPLRV